VARLRSTRFPRISGARRRKVTWSIGPQGQIASINSTSNNIFPSGSIALLNDLTIVRLRGWLNLWITTANASADGFQWAFGICNITENAAGVGVTAIPDPLVDVAWDGWFVYDTGWLEAVNNTPIVDVSIGVMHRLMIDSKAMRKVHATDVLTAALGVSEVGTASMRASLSTRVLAKLP